MLSLAIGFFVLFNIADPDPRSGFTSLLFVEVVLASSYLTFARSGCGQVWFLEEATFTLLSFLQKKGIDFWVRSKTG